MHGYVCLYSALRVKYPNADVAGIDNYVPSALPSTTPSEIQARLQYVMTPFVYVYYIDCMILPTHRREVDTLRAEKKAWQHHKRELTKQLKRFGAFFEARSTELQTKRDTMDPVTHTRMMALMEQSRQLSHELEQAHVQLELKDGLVLAAVVEEVKDSDALRVALQQVRDATTRYVNLFSSLCCDHSSLVLMVV